REKRGDGDGNAQRARENSFGHAVSRLQRNLITRSPFATAGERTRLACWLRCSAATIFSCATPWHPGDSWEKFAITRTRPLPRQESRRTLRDLFPELQRAENEQQVGHHNEYGEIWPVFEKICATQDDCAHQRDEISRGEERTKGVKDPRHGFPRKNKSG